MSKCYSVEVLDSNNIKDLKKDIEGMINNYTELCYDEENIYNKFHSAIPIYNEDNEIEKILLIFNDDEPKFDVCFIINNEQITKELTKYNLDIIMNSDVVTLDDKEYKIKSKKFNLDDYEVIIECM
ncbi:hypothetical protein [Anaerophilus nitritogenes]|uniref:hypothetical protein n=1 Tax=Anaerophilus nitritogenes TaxID=2498136 RepID=UPI00101DB770|nr:hypothetical protein [Anaerophilus nitritogenes]